MSKVVIQGNASGTGNFTIAAPNSNTDRTFNLPDEAGTIVTTAGLPSGLVTASDLPSGTVLQTVYHDFDDVTSTTTSQAYVSVTNGSTSLTSIGANSKFLVTISASVYQAAGAGGHIGCNRTVGGTTTRIMGVDGSSGDAWLGHGNGPGATHSASASITRQFLDEPSQSAGTSITYSMLLGRWTQGTFYINYSGSGSKASIMIQEIAA